MAKGFLGGLESAGKSLGSIAGGFATKESDNFTKGGILGPLLGQSGAAQVYSIFGSAGNLLAGAGSFLSSPMMPFLLAAGGGVVLLIVLKK